MQIAFVVPDDATAWLYYRHLIEALVEAGSDVTVLSAPGPYVARFTAKGIRHIALPYARFVAPLDDVRLLIALRKAFRINRFDVVQNFTVKANLYGAWAAVRAGVPSIINTVEGAGILWSDRPGIRVRLMRNVVEAGLRALKGHVFLYWFVNEYDRSVFIKRGLASAARAVVAISTGVDTDQFDPEAITAPTILAFRNELGIGPDRPIITMVAGRLLQSKGVEPFVGVARRLRHAGIDVQAILVGPEEPGHPDALDPLIVSRAVNEGLIRWIGFRDDIPMIYAASEIVVVPTTYPEGIAKSVVEAMAMARAVICSRTPAIEEMIEPGIDAILVDPLDEAALFTAVGDLLENPRLRTEIGRAARATVVRRFDARREAVSAISNVYAQIPGWPGVSLAAARDCNK